MKSLFYLFFTLCSLLWSSEILSQSDPAERTMKALSSYYLQNLPEKVYVVTDKPYYAQADTIWYDVFLVNAISHEPLTYSNTVYVDLIRKGESEVIEQQIVLTREGLAPGEFVIGEKWTPGKYMIRAYTHWMQNYPDEFLFTKEFDIYNVWPQEDSVANAEKPNVVTSSTEVEGTPIKLQLFPEGGQLVKGIGNVLGVKTTIDRRPVGVSGQLTNQKTGASQLIKTDEYGLGMVFMSNPGADYTIQLDSPSTKVTYELPEVTTSGYAMRVYNRFNAKNTMVILETDIPGGLENCYLIGHTRGEVFAAFTLQGVSNLSQKMISIANETIPSGVVNLTLFDPQSRPRAERLFFVNHGDKIISPEINLTNDKVKSREKVGLDISLGDTLSGFTSITVTNNSAIQRVPHAENIGSYLLLSSDLKGNIEDPTQYFDTEDREAFARLNYVMLTHGWRRFSWQDVLDSTRLDIQWESGITVSGQLKNFINRKNPETGYVQLVAMPLANESILQGFDMRDQYTDSLGRFLFNKLLFQDSVKFVLTSKKKEKGKINRFYIDQDEVPPPALPSFSPGPFQIDDDIKNFIEKKNKEFVIDKSYGEQVIMLDEMTVEGKKETPVQDAVGGRYISPDYRVLADSIIVPTMRLVDILRQIPFVMLDNNGNPQIRNQTPEIFIDGYQIDPSFAMDYVQSMASDDVFFVDVDRAGNTTTRGVPTLYIYTKSGNGIALPPSTMEDPGLLRFIHPGYHAAREFYTPDYSTPSEKPDYRLQLYWQPDIRIDSGKAHVEFYVGDDRGTTYDIVIEGMTKSGKAVVGKSQVKVE